MRGIEMHLTENARGIVSLLEIVSPARRSLLGVIQRLLFKLRIQIVQVESSAHEDARVERFHLVEFDGTPIGRRRAAAIRSAVRKAIRAIEVAA